MHKLLSVFLVGMSMTVCSTTALASNRSNSYFISNGQRVSIEDYRSPLESPIAVRPTKAPARILSGMGEPKHLTMRIVNTDGLIPLMVKGGLDWFGLNEDPEDGKLIEVANGINVLMIVAQKVDPQSETVSGVYTVVRDIRDLQDGDDVTFDFDECVHRVSFVPVGEDGEMLVPSVQMGNADGTATIVEQHDYLDAFGTVSFHSSLDGIIMDDIHFLYTTRDENGDRGLIQYPDIYVNSPGSHFAITPTWIFDTQDGLQTIVQMPSYIGTDDTAPSEVVIKNDPASYRIFENTMVRSPYSMAIEPEIVQGVNVGLEVEGYCSGALGREFEPTACGREVTDRKRVSVVVTDESSRHAIVLCDGIGSSSEQLFALASDWYNPQPDGSRRYIAMNTLGLQAAITTYSSTFLYTNELYSPWGFFPRQTNKWIAFSENKRKGMLGNNCPIIVAVPSTKMNQLYELGSDRIFLELGLVGRYGEGTLQGLEILEEGEANNVAEYDADNKRHMTYSYDNVLVDNEIEGEVKATITVVRGEWFEDFSAPTLNYLWFYNNETADITDRFDTGEEGRMVFYATDFASDFDWELGEYDIPKYTTNEIASVTVEYAPYNTNEFSPLTAQHESPLDVAYGYGQYYTASLEDVSLRSANGWYDIRITLTDERGNSLCQTVSPAFKIGEGAAIEAIGADRYNSPAVWYNLQGVKVSYPADGIFIKVENGKSTKIKL